ncbi:hypothetical protein DFJ74DRAFT_662934 [Hyaloraphidium curvatum]|nr:hypothetical protein DFJ74DRAFT_662934 [Hyaloraphidium curvatum]
MAFDLDAMPALQAYDTSDPSIVSIINPHPVPAPARHVPPEWFDESKVRSPAKGDTDPFGMSAEDAAVFHITPVEEYKLPEDMLRELDVVCIGAGMAGITAGIMSQWRLKKVNLRIFEKNPELGGTWWENRYPGCKCDVPSHAYVWRFAPNDWVSGYPSSHEIFEYFRRVYWEYGVDQFVRYNSPVFKLAYDDASAKWEVHVRDLTTGREYVELADVVINGQGFLNRPKWPEIPGLRSYQGKMLHAARWDTTYSTVGKDVAIIGTGSSGMQIIGAIGATVKHMTIFQRTPSWITPHFANIVFTPEERKNFKDKDFFWNYYKRSWETNERFWAAYTEGTRMQTRVLGMAMDKLVKSVKDEELRKKLTPSYPWGCRRMTPSLNFLDVVQLSHVDLVSGDVISHVVPEGVVTKDGKLHKCEALICATGFNTTYYNEDMPIYGRGGRSLKDDWADFAWAHNSMTVTGYPKLFYCMGPLAPVAANSIFIQEEQQMNYIFSAIKYMQQSPKPVKAFDPHKEPIFKFLEDSQTFLKETTVWKHSCGGWYTDRNGRIVQWPGPSNHYLDHIKKIDLEQYDVEYWTSDEERLEAAKRKKEEVDARNAKAAQASGARL